MGLKRNSDSQQGEQPDTSIRVDEGDSISRAGDEASPYEQRGAPKRGRLRRGMSIRQSFKPPAQLFRADMLMQRLREFGVMGGDDEEAANVVDVTNVYQELPAFLQEKLPLWDEHDQHAHFITYFQHDPALVRPWLRYAGPRGARCLAAELCRARLRSVCSLEVRPARDVA